MSLLVDQAGTGITLTSSAAPLLSGNSVTFTATVAPASPGAPAPSGTITFKDGTNVLGSPVTLNGAGVATFSTNSLTVGSHSITAVYSGNGNDASSVSTALTEMVQENTTTVLTSNANPIYFGSSVLFTATVTASVSGTPTGSVTFNNGTTTLGTATLNGSGVAMLSISAMAAGPHSVTAVYSDDAINLPSSSSALAQTVNVGNFTLTANPGSQSITSGQTATFTLTLTPQGSFTTPVDFSCSGLPMMAACAFSPATITPDANTVTTTLTINTVGHAAMTAPPSPGTPDSRAIYRVFGTIAGVLAFLGILCLWTGSNRSRQMGKAVLFAGLLLIVVGSHAACAGSGKSSNAYTPAGTSQLQVTTNSSGAGGTVTHSVSLTLSIR